MKKSKILIPIICCSLVGAALAVVPFTMNHNSSQVTASFVGEVKDPFSKTYFYIDEEVQIAPKDIVFENKVHTCTDFYIKYPDGSQKNGTKFRLNQAGEYTIVYLSERGGMIVEAKENIYAYKRAYSVNKEASSSAYADEIICEQNNPTGGIQTFLAEGDVWTYNQAIDISKSDLNTPIIKYYTRQSSELANHVSIDVTATVIRLTDFYDETNYVDIYNTYNDTNPSTHRMQPYVTACAPGQLPSGIDLTNRSSKTISYEGVTYFLHNSNRAWGACLDTVPGTYGINGTRYDPDIANSDNRGFTIFYDYAKKVIYCQHRSLHLVTDLDEPAIYSQTLFKGFTTGEVILSVRCDGYKETMGYFEISEIYGKKGAELNSDYAYDDKAPIISLSNNANNFYIANGEPFTLFTATATDPHIVGDVTAQVYYDYGTDNQRFVPIVDGKFTPTSIGKYTVVYTARDTYGNVSTRTVACNSITAKDNQIVGLDFNPQASADAGTSVHFEKPVLNGYNEGLYYKVTAINEKNNERVELDKDKMDLFLKYAGQYTIRVEYGDISCKRVKDFAFTSNTSSNAYLEETTLPKYFIKDAKHSLDSNKVVLCTQDTPTYASAEVYMKSDDNEYDSSPINSREFEVSASNTVQFKYTYNGNTIYETEKVPVVDVDFTGNVEFKDYFAGDFENKNDADGVTFSSSNNGGSASTEFINPLAFSIFSCDLLFNAKTGFKSIDLIMKDYAGKADDFVISFYFIGSNLCFVHDDISGEIGMVDNASIRYDSLNKVLSVGNGVSFPTDNPFESDRLYLSFKANDIKLEAGETSKDVFTVKQISNQVLSSDASGGDYTGGQIGYTKLGGQRNINTSIVISRSVAIDVLSPYVVNSHKLRVTHKNNIDDPNTSATVVVSKDGVALDGSEDVNREYEVLLDKHGVYLINYTYEDQNYNKVDITEIIYVDDNEDPEITIDGISQGTVEVINLGEEITIRGYSVKDESSVSVKIYAVSPTNSIQKITGKKFKPSCKGDWHIVYYAEDANHNVSSASYTVRVK